MDGISWTHATRRLVAHRRCELAALLSLGKTKTRDPAKDFHRLQLRDIDEARRIVACAREQVWKLRHLLVYDCYNACSMNDSEVLEHAAAMLVRGEWVIFERRASEARKQSHGSGAAVRNLRAVPANVPAPRQPSPGRAEMASPPIEETSEPFHQDAQAGTLRLAAANGTPFCEICEAARHGRRKARHSGAHA